MSFTALKLELKKIYIFTSWCCLPYYYNEKSNTESYMCDDIRDILGYDHSMADKKFLLLAFC